MRLYCPSANITRDKIVILDPGQIHHLSSVKRLKKGDQVVVFDGNSHEYECLIESIFRNKVELSVGKIRKTVSGELVLSLACALPKKVKMDYIIEKTVELGVDRIIPLRTERTIVEYSSLKAKEKLKRWQAIALEASKQCGRIKLPEIDPVTLFRDAVSKIKEYDLALIANLEVDNQDLKVVMSNFSRCGGIPLKAGKGQSIIIFIGPEGDFSPREIKLAEENGCSGVSLGDLVLKVDTAAISVIAFLRLSDANTRESIFANKNSRLFASHYEDI